MATNDLNKEQNFPVPMESTKKQAASTATGRPPSEWAADLVLVKRVQQGDRAAFDLLVVK